MKQTLRTIRHCGASDQNCGDAQGGYPLKSPPGDQPAIFTVTAEGCTETRAISSPEELVAYCVSRL